MTRHVVAKVSEVSPGARKLVEVAGREIALFNIKGRFFGIGNRCPHEGASLCQGVAVGLAASNEPGVYTLSRQGEILRCPWHGWDFDIRTGRSWCDPNRVRVKSYDVGITSGAAAKDYAVETYAVSVDEDYVVIDLATRAVGPEAVSTEG